MTFIVGLIVGAVSGGFTYALTDDAQLGLIVGAVVTVLAWCGVGVLFILDD